MFEWWIWQTSKGQIFWWATATLCHNSIITGLVLNVINRHPIEIFASYQNGYVAKWLKESPLSSTGLMVYLSSCLLSLSASATTARCRCHAATPRRPASCWWGSSTLWCRTWVLCQTASPSTWSWFTMTMVTHTHKPTIIIIFYKCNINWIEQKI